MANRSSFLRSVSLVLLIALFFGAIGAVQAAPNSHGSIGKYSVKTATPVSYSRAVINPPEIPHTVTQVEEYRTGRAVALNEGVPEFVKSTPRINRGIPNRTLIIGSLKDRVFGNVSRPSSRVSGTGTVVCVDFGGVFYGIIADDDTHYLPGNLPASCRVNGMRVKFYGIKGEPEPNIRMWGTPLRLLSVSPLGDEIRANGTIEFIDLEGGFYGIVTTGGEHYLPMNLPVDFQVDGLKVTFTARTAPDMNTIYMWGTPVSIVTITRATESGQPPVTSLRGQWTLVSMAKEYTMTPVIRGTEITAYFSDDGKVSGRAGCNLYGGSYEATGHSLEIDHVYSTLMYCTDNPEGIMEQESAFFQILADVASWEVRDDLLVISDAWGRDLLLFSPGVEDESDAAEPMVEFWRTGGFAGMDDHLTIYPDGSASLSRKGDTVSFTLNESELDSLVTLLENSGFMNLAPQYQAPAGSADLFLYQICWQGKTVLVEDTVIPETLRDVIDELTLLLVEKYPGNVT